LKSDLAVGWAYVDQCLREHINRELTTYAASTAKLLITEMHGRVVDQCLQFFGGYGFMREYEICRLYADARAAHLRRHLGNHARADFAEPLAGECSGQAPLFRRYLSSFSADRAPSRR
jgi:alkylation response protein AidB-like acyl-CoA dehydrogenase